MKIRVAFFGKLNDELCRQAADYLKTHGVDNEVYLGKRSDPFPTLLFGDSWDYIISYLSPWIIPLSILNRARKAAINFHPGPPEFPGIGCTNFAIYQGVSQFGVTCHHMVPQVDSGPIIRVVRFPVYPEETVLSLTYRSYSAISSLFYELADCLLTETPFPISSEKWVRTPFRRSDLEALCRLSRGMTEEEINRRIRSTTFPGYPAASFPTKEIQL